MPHGRLACALPHSQLCECTACTISCRRLSACPLDVRYEPVANMRGLRCHDPTAACCLCGSRPCMSALSLCAQAGRWRMVPGSWRTALAMSAPPVRSMGPMATGCAPPSCAASRRRARCAAAAHKRLKCHFLQAPVSRQMLRQRRGRPWSPADVCFGMRGVRLGEHTHQCDARTL